MIRRLVIALATGLVMLGAVGARLGQAQQQEPVKKAPSPTPADNAPPPPLGDDAPPPVGNGDTIPEPAPTPAKQKSTPKARPAKPALPKAPEEAVPAEPKPLDPRADEPVELPTRPAPVEAPKTDGEVMPVQTPPAGDGSTLPPAKENGTPAPAGDAPQTDPLILSPERLPLGPSTGSLTVEVQGPPNANLNRPVKFKIFVKNSGVGPVMGVVVRDPLPDGLEFVKAEPACTQVGNILTWQLESLAAGQERTLIVTAVPKKVGDFDHAPTVSLRVGSRSRTMVKHPKLKVEVLNNETGTILKGRPVNFTVRVTNNGTGPARAVILRADLTPGLTHDQGSSLKVDFKEWSGRDALASGESETIDLSVDAAAGGEQECKVTVESIDVEDAPEAHASAKVTVVEPKLELKLVGSTERYTDTVASYTLTVKNSGTAPAKNVVAAAFLPNLGGQLVQDFTPSEARYGAKEKKLWWGVGDLEPGGTKELKFNVQLRGPGVFKVEAAARADKGPQLNESFSTQVIGVADIKCEVVARTKTMDVGEETIYEVRLSNTGTKEAPNVLVTAILSENLEVQDTTGTEGNKQASSTTKERHDAVFPAINIAKGASHALTLKVKATKAGPAKCTVKVVHDESSTEYTTTTKVNMPK